MKKLQKLAVVTSVVGLLLSSSSLAFAGPLNQDVNTKVSQSIVAGALTLQAPADVSLSDVVTSSEVVSNTGEALDLQIDDARGKKPAAQPGWTATVTMSRLTDIGDSSFYIPFYDSVADQNVYTLTPNDLEALFGADVADISLGSSTQLLDADADGVSDAVTVMSAPATKGRGRFQADVTIDLLIPANTPAANYESTLTFTVS